MKALPLKVIHCDCDLNLILPIQASSIVEKGSFVISQEEDKVTASPSKGNLIAANPFKGCSECTSDGKHLCTELVTINIQLSELLNRCGQEAEAAF